MNAASDKAKPVKYRDPALVMKLDRLGSIHQCRLSFMRILTRRMKQENWTFTRPVFEIDDKGVGHAVYTATGPERAYSLVAFAHDLPAEQRSDRVIATAWDATFTLFDGVPTAAEIEQLSKNIPLQEAGRVSVSSLSVSRANRSVRLWEHMVSALASGQQPDREMVDKVGYLMRTTAVYGSGKLGSADFEVIADRPEMAAPFQAEMLSVYLTRAFVRDLVQHMANARGGDKAVTLDARIARSMGIGNSTGLGLGPFIINHPVLFNNWIEAKEVAIARVRGLQTASKAEVTLFRKMLERAALSAKIWRSEHAVQVEKLADLRADLARLSAHIETADLSNDQPWDRLYNWAEDNLTLEGQESVASLILEAYGDLVDDLAPSMADKSSPLPIDGSMKVKAMADLLERDYGWALAIDWNDPETHKLAWYVSAEKLEPRLGDRYGEGLEPYQLPLSPGRDAAALTVALDEWPSDATMAEFLLRHPEHRFMVRRALQLANVPYGEIHDNTIATSVFPIDFLRFKLGVFGATHFDPRSDRWVRISMYGNAPFPEELGERDADFWVYPEMEGELA
jgi:hypothetical protein